MSPEKMDLARLLSLLSLEAAVNIERDEYLVLLTQEICKLARVVR